MIYIEACFDRVDGIELAFLYFWECCIAGRAKETRNMAHKESL
jgi:hypothetical protein